MTNNPYWAFKKDELTKSKILAKELNISESDFNKIQNWFDLLLLKHEEATTDWEDQLKSEEDLENNLKN
jgi:hypothetical protein